MRTRRVSLCRMILCMSLVFVPGLGHAVPSFYSISFTPSSSPTTPTSGSFFYDPASEQFTQFLVVQAGLTFDLTVEANNIAPGAIVGPRICAAGLSASPDMAFQLMNQTLSGCDQYEWLLVSGGGISRLNFVASSSATGGADVVLFGAGGAVPPPVQQFSGGFAISTNGVSEPSQLYLVLIGSLLLFHRTTQRGGQSQVHATISSPSSSPSIAIV